MIVPKATILLAGDELITGYRRDRIGPQVANRLESLGCELQALVMVPDRLDLIAGYVRNAVEQGIEVMILCGGLGPTEDDCTRQAVADGLGLTLELDESALQKIQARYRQRGRNVPVEARRQALRPEGSEAIPNPIGTAPGFLSRKGRTMIAALPGVPREFDEMFARSVLPVLNQTLSGSLATAMTVLHVAGLQESEVHRRLSERLAEAEAGYVKYLARPGQVELIVNARDEDATDAKRKLAAIVTMIRERLGHHVYGQDDTTLVGVLGKLLVERGWMVSIAESCTGGLVGKRITDHEGASSFFAGGVIAYDNREKAELLGVPGDLLERFGAVSSEVARAMAEGCRRRLGTELALSVTGIAGPAGGSADKPVGLVYLGLAMPDRHRVLKHTFSGDRANIRHWAATAVLDEARRALLGLAPLGHQVDPAAEELDAE